MAYDAMLAEWRMHTANHPRVVNSNYPFRDAPPVEMNADKKFDHETAIRKYGWLIAR